jgi:hypothetical protein
MPEKKTRNLHTAIRPSSLRLARGRAALEGRAVGDIVDAAIAAYCSRLAAVAPDDEHDAAPGLKSPRKSRGR